MSDSQPGEPVAAAFPHLASAYPQLRFSSQARRAGDPVRRGADGAVLGGTARGVRRAHRCAADGGRAGRHASRGWSTSRRTSATAAPRPMRPSTGTRTAAPARLAQFSCAVPEHLSELTTPHVAHPGCFATAILLASVPLLAAGLVTPSLFVSGVTGSTGSGRKPVPGTHHPAAARRPLQLQRPAAPPRAGGRRLRRGGLGSERKVRVRAALGTVCARHPRDPAGAAQPQQRHAAGHQRAAGVLLAARHSCASAPMPRASRTWRAATTRTCQPWSADGTVAVLCAIDNLNKGAAGGAMQWMNRLFALPETAGLTAPAPGWT